ncbi:hypothetical protein FHS96_004440 [Sphingomonas zeicaulis]|uniref:hypothetical protein n=1 Tax=Sphingomonas zeicaulis TaxID=1632740 RepID=UPI003D1D5B97
MRDELDGRLWADHHESFTNSVTDGLRAFGRLYVQAMCKLTEIEYAAPWRVDAARRRKGRC